MGDELAEHLDADRIEASDNKEADPEQERRGRHALRCHSWDRLDRRPEQRHERRQRGRGEEAEPQQHRERADKVVCWAACCEERVRPTTDRLYSDGLYSDGPI